MPVIPTMSHNLHARAHPTSLSLVLIFTILSSLGTGVVTTGIFFLTRNAYGFSDVENYLLAFVQGITYIGGAMLASRAVTFVRAALGGVPTRTVLGLVIAVLGVLCLIPAGARWAGQDGSWPVWVLMLIYSPLSGVLWPMVESYLSGGRRERELRRAVGLFNVGWAGALVISFWAMGPFVEKAPVLVIFALGVLHIATLALVVRFRPEPGEHSHGHHEHPPIYDRLLRVFRVLLPTSYIVSSALGPTLPGVIERLGVAAEWATPLASIWQTARMLGFLTLERWHGWHGRWGLAIVGVALMLGGFAGIVLAPMVPAGLAMPALVAGLIAFGLGMAGIYAAALYYAMEVGQAEVDAGGTHEALIGVGYTVGPICGLVPSYAAQQGAIDLGSVSPLMLGSVTVIAVTAISGSAWTVKRRR
jgi:MFS family permease